MTPVFFRDFSAELAQKSAEKKGLVCTRVLLNGQDHAEGIPPFQVQTGKSFSQSARPGEQIYDRDTHYLLLLPHNRFRVGEAIRPR
jgi:hypothetical protein